MKAILRNCSRGVQQLRMKKRKEQINQAMFGAMCQFGTTSNERKRRVNVFFLFKLQNAAQETCSRII
jgi:hypothetical protein